MICVKRIMCTLSPPQTPLLLVSCDDSALMVELSKSWMRQNVFVSPINVAGMAGPKLASGARVAGQLIAPSEEHDTENANSTQTEIPRELRTDFIVF